MKIESIPQSDGSASPFIDTFSYRITFADIITQSKIQVNIYLR